MIWRRLLGVVAALTLLVGVSACAVPSSDAVQGVASSSSPAAPAKYGFSVLKVYPAWGTMTGADAIIYVPVFTSGVVVRVFSVEPDALGSEVCMMSVVADEVEASGACSRLGIERLDSSAPDRLGTLDGLRVLLTGLEQGDHEFDVFMYPVAQNTKTGEWRYDYEAPSVGRLLVHVPAA